jgi:hypothetical protein
VKWLPESGHSAPKPGPLLIRRASATIQSSRER